MQKRPAGRFFVAAQQRRNTPDSRIVHNPRPTKGVPIIGRSVTVAGLVLHCSSPVPQP